MSTVNSFFNRPVQAFIGLLFIMMATAACNTPPEAEPVAVAPTDIPATAVPLEATATQLPPTVTPEPVATETAEPMLTTTPDPRAINDQTKRVVFSENSAQVPNANARQELAQRGGGGGGDLSCHNDLYSWRINTPQNQFKIHEKGLISVCLDPTDAGTLTIYDSLDQIIHQETFSADLDSSADAKLLVYEWETDILTDPLGTYRVVVDYGTALFEQEIEVYSPEEPRLIWLAETDVVITGFEPNEAVLFYIYEQTDQGYAPLIATIPESVDPHGEMVVQLSFTSAVAMIAVEGELSGQAIPKRDSSISTGRFDSVFWPVSDTGVESCHLKSYVTEENVTPLRVTSTADLFDPVAAMMPPQQSPLTPIGLVDAGTAVTVIDGAPRWNFAGSENETSGWFWLVEFADGRGYIWEGHIEGC